MMFSISSAVCFVVGGLPVWFDSIFTGKMCRQVYVVTIKPGDGPVFFNNDVIATPIVVVINQQSAD